MLTKGAIGNLVNRYKAVLRKCNLINTFGSLAVASMLVLGGAGVAGAADITASYEDGKTLTSNGETVCGYGTITANGNLTIESTGGNAIRSKDAGETLEIKAENGNLTLKADESVSSGKPNGNAIQAEANVDIDVKGNLNLLGNNRVVRATNSAEVTLDADAIYMNAKENGDSVKLSDTAAIKADGTSSVTLKAGTIVINAINDGRGDLIGNNNNAAYGVHALGSAHVEFTGNTTINAATDSSGPAYAVYNQSSATSTIGASDKSSTISLTATNTGTGTARGIYNDGGTLTVNGNVDIKTNTTSGLSLGIDNRGGGTLTVNGSNLNIEVKSTSDRAYGIQTSGNSETFINSENVTINSYAENLWQAAVRTNSNSAITFTNNVTANLFYGQLSADSGSSENIVAGIHVNEGTATFQKGLKVSINDTTTNLGTNVGALWAVGNSQNSDTANNKISVAGHTELTINTASRSGMGITTGCKARVDLTSANITLISSEGSAYGIYSSGNSTASIAGDAVINATGKKDAYGIFTDTEHGGGNFSLTGATNTITATSTGEGDAYAVYMNGGTGVIGSTSSTSTLNGDIFVAEGASLTLKGKVNLNGLAEVADTGTVNTNEVTELSASGEVNDALAGNRDALAQMLGKESVEAMGDTAVTMDEGLIQGAVDANGKQEANTILVDTLDIATAAPLAVSRIVINDVRKRMGDLRDSKEEAGAWVRWEGGKLKGDSGLGNDFNTIQVGADMLTGIKNVRAGVAAAFTHGDLDHSNGSGEMETYSFSAYGTWMADNGMFADVIARVGFTNTEVSVKGMKADLDNEVLSLSGEYGWRLPICQQFFVEPQVELTYTYITSTDYKLDYASYNIDSVDSLIGRAGAVFGWKLPDERGSLYARASVVHEFLNDSTITASAFGRTEAHSLDGDDTWLEYGIGANVKLTDSTYLWADVERTAGADIDEEWRGTVGIRYSF